MSNDNRNMILAVVLSALVLFGWSAVTNYIYPVANPPATKTENGKQVPVAQPQTQPQPAATTPAATRDRNLVLRETAAERIRIETPSLRGSLSLRGARIDDLVLLRHRETIAANSPPVRLFSPVGTPGAYYASFGWSGAPDTNDLRPRADTLWTASGGTALTPTTPITLTWDNQHGQVYRIVLTVDDGYLFTAEQLLFNRGQPISIGASALVNRVGVSHDPSTWQSHVGPVGVFNGTANYDNNFSHVADAPEHRVSYDSHGGWLGFTDKYWLAAVVPNQGSNVSANFRHLDGDAYQADYTNQLRQLGTNQTMRNSSHLFAGAREIHYLNLYTASLGTDMGRAIDWGWFDFIMKPIFWWLTTLFSLFGNFGFAIIGLTISVRILLFPLAQKQFSSMAKMKVLQPKIKALQARHADDKQRQQQEMMKLYKEEQVNPMAGCLPIFLQIPVFYALYKVLMVSVEMRHQPFIGWIHDLTAPDPATPINLFGLLPFTPPGILAIGVLPIMVGVTMWLQQKMNTAPMDPMQQKIFAWMPWILVVIMAPFAAGFQVYWVTNNLISILQIWFLNRKLGMKTPAAATALAAPAPSPGPAPNKGRTRPRKK